MNYRLFSIVPLVLLLLVVLSMASRSAVADIRSFTVVNSPLDGANPTFQIRVICPQPFLVSGLYATIRDPENSIDIRYTTVFALSNIFGPDFAPPFRWSVAHVPFDPAPGAASTRGYELLSQLGVEKPVGIASGGSFDILGSRSGQNGNETVSVAAVVETDSEDDNSCRVVIVDN